MTGADGGRRHIATSALWVMLDFVLERGSNFIFIVILARLLTPTEFGTVALLTMFIAVANVLVESGFGQAIVQKATVSEEEKSAAFWLNLAIALVVSAAIIVASPAIARFFDQPQLVPLARIMALAPVLAAFGTVQRAGLVRAMQFRALLVVRVAGTFLSGLVTLILVLRGWGATALAVQVVAAAAVTSATLWMMGRWIPRLVFSPSLVRPLFSFGGYLLLAALLETIYSRAYAILIGRLFGPTELGHYARADSSIQLVTGASTYPIVQIALPAFSRMEGDVERVRQGMHGALRTAMLFNAPAMFGLGALAAPFVLTVYGSQWREAAPILAILSIGAAFLPMHVLNLQVLLSLGRSGTFLGLEVFKKAVGIAIIVLSSRWGTYGVAWGVTISGLVTLIPNASQMARLARFGLFAQLRAVAPIIACAAAMAVAVDRFVALALPAAQPPFQLLAGAAFGAVAFAGAALAFDLGGARGLGAAAIRRTTRWRQVASPPAPVPHK